MHEGAITVGILAYPIERSSRNYFRGGQETARPTIISYGL